MKYKTQGVCSSFIDIEMDGNIIKSVQFTGGCNGNLQGISALVKDRPLWISGKHRKVSFLLLTAKSLS